MGWQNRDIEMKPAERILDMWLNMPSQTNWEWSQRTGNNRWGSFLRREIASTPWSEGLSPDLMSDIFYKVITSMGFITPEEFEEKASYQQLLECFELALRYAKNWTFS